MSNTEWFLLVVVVIVVPLVIAIVVTLWTLEMARQRKRSNRPGAAAMVGVKRNAMKAESGDGSTSLPAADAAGEIIERGPAADDSPDGLARPTENPVRNESNAGLPDRPRTEQSNP